MLVLVPVTPLDEDGAWSCAVRVFAVVPLELLGEEQQREQLLVVVGQMARVDHGRDRLRHEFDRAGRHEFDRAGQDGPWHTSAFGAATTGPAKLVVAVAAANLDARYAFLTDAVGPVEGAPPSTHSAVGDRQTHGPDPALTKGATFTLTP
jgi:hypothetical protein